MPGGAEMSGATMGVQAGAMSWGVRLITFGIAFVAYTTAAMVGALVFGGIEFLRHPYGFMNMNTLLNGTMMIGALAFIPFLLAKAAMAESGNDGYFAHVKAGAMACALIGLLGAALFSMGSPRWGELLVMIGGFGLWGAVCGSAYWVVRALGWHIVRGVAR